jgi:hypothetical protein
MIYSAFLLIAVLSCYYLVICSSSSLSPLSVDFNSISFIPANSFQGHAQTCLLHNLQPLQLSSFIVPGFSWNASTVSYVVMVLLGKSLFSSSSQGLTGCCAPGLWCKKDTNQCFTSSFGSSFSNYGWLTNDNNSVPYFSCWDPVSSGFSALLSFPVEVGSATTSLDSSQLQLRGINFGNQDDLAVSLLGQSCSNLEVGYCKSCASSGDCPVGQTCFTAMDSGKSYCTPLCAGNHDTSCPCNQVCYSTRNSADLLTSLCLPLKGYSTFCSAVEDLDYLFCNANNAMYSTYATSSTVDNFEVATSLQGVSYSQPSSLTTMHCSSNHQCFDGNICTTDSCELGKCHYQRVINCSSIEQSIREQYTPYNYNPYILSSSSIQSSYFSDILRYGKLSKTSNTTLQGSETIRLPWSTLYFGNLINQASIVPFGLLSLPPYGNCYSTYHEVNLSPFVRLLFVLFLSFCLCCSVFSFLLP